MVQARSAVWVAIALVLQGCSSSSEPSAAQVESPSQSGSIGVSGGSLVLADGTRIDVPQGALSDTITIRITQTTAPENAVGPAYLMEPEGQVFTVPVTITLPYAPEKIPANAAAVMLTAPAGQSTFTELETTVVDSGHAQASTTHFSVFHVSSKAAPPGVALATSENFPATVVSDGAQVYWVNQGSVAHPLLPGQGLIMRVPAGGGAASVLGPPQQDPKGLAVGTASVFWTNGGTMGLGAGLWNAPLAGGAPALLTPASFPSGIAVSGGTVVFADAGSGEIRSLSELGGPTTLLAAAQNPRSVVVEDATAFFTSVGKVSKVRLSGGPVVVLADGQNDPRGIAVGGGYVYWVNRGEGTVMRAPTIGGAAKPLAQGQDRPMGIAVDSFFAYFTNMGSGTVSKVPLNGGKVTILASDQPVPLGITLDDKNVYWTNNGKTVNQGSVMRISK